MRGVLLLLASLFLAVGCGLLSSEDHSDQDRGPPAPTRYPDDPLSRENLKIEHHTYDTTVIRVKGTVGGVQFQETELTETISDYGSVTVAYRIGENQYRTLPWHISSPLGELEFTYAYEPERVYLLFLTEEKDVIRSALPTGRIRVVLAEPQDTTERTLTQHRVSNYRKQLESIGLIEVDTTETQSNE